MKSELKTRRFAFITWSLIIICFAIYGIEVKLSHSLNINSSTMATLGAVNSKLVNDDGLWRIFASMWLHWSPEHILSNMFFLYLAGRQIEREFGHIRFLAIYLFSGIIGDYFACYLSNPDTLSAGASTALFGIMLAGATLKWTIKDNECGTVMLQLFVSNIVLDVFMPGISLVGHLGGALAGGILGILLQPRNKEKWYTNLIIQILFCLGITAMLIIRAF